MPLADPPRPSMDLKSPADIADYLIGFVRWLADFINHIDTLNVEELDAVVVNTGTLNANLVTVAAANGGRSFTIDTNGIKANNGSVDTLKFDLATGLLTIVSALIQSATGYPRVELNSATNLIAAYSSANDHIDITPTIGGAPGTSWYVAGVLTAYLNCSSLGPLLASFAGTPLTFQSSADMNFNPSGNLRINGSVGQTGTIYVSATPGGVANIPITFSKGIRTS